MATTTSSTSTNSKPRPAITVTQPTPPHASIPAATSTLTNAFLTDPIFLSILNTTPTHLRTRTISTLLHLTLHLGVSNHGQIHSAHISSTSATPFQTAALIFPPGYSLDNLPWTSYWTALRRGFVSLLWTTGFAPLVRFQNEYIVPVTKAKASIFPGKKTPYYYLSHIGTLSSARGQGLAPALIRNLQARAQEEKVPIWLESSSEGSRKVYARCGFVDVLGEKGEVGIRMGVGRCDEKGEVAQGEEAVGVVFFPMVWWPEGYKREEVEGEGEGKKVV